MVKIQKPLRGYVLLKIHLGVARMPMEIYYQAPDGGSSLVVPTQDMKLKLSFNTTSRKMLPWY